MAGETETEAIARVLLCKPRLRAMTFDERLKSSHFKSPSNRDGLHHIVSIPKGHLQQTCLLQQSRIGKWPTLLHCACLSKSNALHKFSINIIMKKGNRNDRAAAAARVTQRAAIFWKANPLVYKNFFPKLCRPPAMNTLINARKFYQLQWSVFSEINGLQCRFSSLVV